MPTGVESTRRGLESSIETLSDCELFGFFNLKQKPPTLSKVEPIDAAVRVSALEGGFSFMLSFSNRVHVVRAERVLSAFEAGERYISGGRGKTFEL